MTINNIILEKLSYKTRNNRKTILQAVQVDGLILLDELNVDPNDLDLKFLHKELRFDEFVEDTKSLQDNTEERENDLEMLSNTIEWTWEH